MKKIITIIGVLIFALTAVADNQITDRRTTITYTGRITTKTTTPVTSSTCYVSAASIVVSAAGTTQTLVIQDKAGTPILLYTAGTAIAVGNTYITFNQPVLMTGGIDIVTGGTTAGTQDIKITYWQ